MNWSRRDFLKISGFVAAASSTGCSLFQNHSDGWNENDLAEIQKFAPLEGGQAWAVWQGRRQVAEWHSNHLGPAFSITKSIAGLGASQALREGWLEPSEIVAKTLTEWASDPMKSRVTVLMLLQQVSGLDAGGIPLYHNHPADKGKVVIAVPCVDTPGTVFRYGPSHWETLAEVMKRKLAKRRESLSDFMAKSVMNRIDLNCANWRSDKSGVPYFSTGVELEIAELGRLGRVLGRLLEGHDDKGFSASCFAEIAKPSKVNPMFGGGFWHNSNASLPNATSIEVEHCIGAPLPESFWHRACLSKKQPPSFVALIGSGGRRIYIWPPTERRIARFGNSNTWSDEKFLSKLDGESTRSSATKPT
jgi:CubicO group peptidase (beta-lactamase class C family)